MNEESFGNWVKQRRRKLDLKQRELAECVHCSIDTIRKIESDERRPSPQLAMQLAQGLGIDESDIGTFLKCARGDEDAHSLTVIPLPTTSLISDRLNARWTPPEFSPFGATLPYGTVTFLVTGVDGIAHMREHYYQEAQSFFEHQTKIVRHAVATYQGGVFSVNQDEIYSVFATAPMALAAALAAQCELHSDSDSRESVKGLGVRMALHTGTVVEGETGYGEKAISRAARLLAAGHGGQILLSGATEALVRDDLPPGTTLQDLKVHQLEGAYSVHIFQVNAPNLPSQFPSLHTHSQQPTNVPASPSALIGRQTEIDRVCALLRRPDVRLLTLTGPGGTGKTRLGLRVATELLGEFTNGVFWVALAPISDPLLVPATIAQALGVVDMGSQTPTENLKEHLRGRQMLLMLDNFEQVIEASVLVAELLNAAPQLKILVTSRAILHLGIEHEFEVPSLTLPDLQEPLDEKSLSEYGAVELFVQRTLAVKPDFRLTAQNAGAVAEICVRLDGLPLAIELAAARSKMLSPQAMLSRLGKPLSLLTSGPLDLPTRQRTLWNTIDWSYKLLDSDEQVLFTRLAVFVGGCTLAAIESVCVEHDLSADRPTLRLHHIMNDTESLMNKSLLHQENGPDGEPRFIMLETIREYALERMRTDGEVAWLQARHAEHYVLLVEMIQAEQWGLPQGSEMDRIAAEYANFRVALEWSRAHDIESGLRIAGRLWWFWQLRGYLSEGRDWLAYMLRRTAEPTLIRAQALLGSGVLADSQGDYTLASSLIEESLAISRVLDNKTGMTYALIFLGLVVLSQGDSDRTAALLQESLELGRTLDDKHGVAWSLYGLGLVAYSRGNYEQASKLYDETLALSQEIESKLHIVLSLNNLALVMMAIGNYSRANALLGESLSMCIDLGDKRGVAWVRYYLGTMAHDQGDYQQAKTYYWESLLMRHTMGDRRAIAECLEGLAGVWVAQELAERAAWFCGKAEELREVVGEPMSRSNRVRYDRTIAKLHTMLGATRLADEKTIGRQYTIEQLIAEMQELD